MNGKHVRDGMNMKMLWAIWKYIMMTQFVKNLLLFVVWENKMGEIQVTERSIIRRKSAPIFCVLLI